MGYEKKEKDLLKKKKKSLKFEERKNKQKNKKQKNKKKKPYQKQNQAPLKVQRVKLGNLIVQTFPTCHFLVLFSFVPKNKKGTFYNHTTMSLLSLDFPIW